MTRRKRLKPALGQALVEFAFVAPVVLLVIGATIDIGRGLLLYELLQGASRDTARQATLAYDLGANDLLPDCTALSAPFNCNLSSVVTGAHALDSLGVTVDYLPSADAISTPTYGTYAVNPVDATQPGMITLAGADTSNVVYVFIYSLDSSATPAPQWACGTCEPTRPHGHQRVIIDLKLKWQPVLARFLGIPTSITFDAQTVERLEF
ncbi:MAG: TadE/TadG family type IV pilus assembly protein [Candidatus Dormibacteraceae bacterium]